MLADVAAGTVDLIFRALAATAGRVPAGLRTGPVLHDPHQLLVGPRHPLAERRQLTPTKLIEHPIWMFPMPVASEPGAYYRELADTFRLTIDVVAPNFGNEAFLEKIAGSSRLATLVGQGSRYLWPSSYDLRRIPGVSSLRGVDRAEPSPRSSLPARPPPRPVPESDSNLWLPSWASADRNG